MTKRFLLFCFFCTALHISAQQTIERQKRKWYIPSLATLQFAGNIGTFSAGVGYNMLHDYLQVSILYGYVPPKKGELSINTVAIKNTLSVVKIKLKQNTIQPYFGFTCNLETGNNSFTYLPPQYPNGYYLINSVHLTIFGGIKDRIHIGKNYFLEPYVETGTVDSYMFYYFHEHDIHISQIFSMAIGVNFVF